ncbi:acyl-CoA dehydrogenase family protein, partial [Nocardia abscessus]|uniref:acyl-CoA dehydrogenase family protein n=1 Tax=Nocardia abscessus TaxID=120957 RepID=UPI002457BB8B
MQLTFDPDVEAFRAEFVAFLTEHLPSEAEAVQRSKSSAHVPEWARRWQRLLFDNGWLLPANPPEFGGRNATVLQQYVHLEELSKRRIYHSFNPQGVGIVAASLLSFGTEEQKRRWAVPILRAEITAALGMSEPGAGSDLASLRTRAVRDGGAPRGGGAQGGGLRGPRAPRAGGGWGRTNHSTRWGAGGPYHHPWRRHTRWGPPSRTALVRSEARS